VAPSVDGEAAPGVRSASEGGSSDGSGASDASIKGASEGIAAERIDSAPAESPGDRPLGGFSSPDAGALSQGSAAMPTNQTSGSPHSGVLAVQQEDDATSASSDAPGTGDAVGGFLGHIDSSLSAATSIADAIAPASGSAGSAGPALVAAISLSTAAGCQADWAFAAQGASSGPDAAAIETAAANAASAMMIRLPQHGRFDGRPLAESAQSLVEPTRTSDEAPSPHFAGIISEFLAFDRAALEGAIDRFLEQFDRVGTELVRIEESTGLLSAASAVALTAVATDLIIRQRRARDETRNSCAEDDDGGLAALPGLPNSWSWGLNET
jgi:hypothetical protein